MLNVTRLRVLRELARRGSLAAAAEGLWLTPSGVSQHIAALERETQVKLIQRSGRGVRLTAAGRLLAAQSETIFAALDAAESALHALDGDPIGTLRVAAFPTFVQAVLPAAIRRLAERHPDLLIEIEDLEVDESLDALRAHRIDVAIVDETGWGARISRGDIRAMQLLDDPLGVATASTHPLAGRPSVAWADLSSELWLMERPSSSLFDRVMVECRRAGFEPRVRAWVRDISAALALVESGCGISVLPRLALARRSPALGWSPIGRPAVRRHVMALVREERERMPSVQALVEELRAVSREYGAETDADSEAAAG